MKVDLEVKQSVTRFLLKNLEKCSILFDSSKFTLLFFVLSGLDFINALDELPEKKKKEIIDWIYSQQLHPDDEQAFKEGKFGFGSASVNGPNSKFDYCNLAMTYSALVSLITLGDDLSRINRTAIIRGLKEHQMPDGRFVQVLIEEEDDLRIIYCATAICYILQDWSSIDQKTIISFIKSCQTFENGFGQRPGTEAHGGSTFCAVASLYLMNSLNEVFNEEQREKIASWCLHRQITGFQGRSGKDPDTCYSFWVGGALSLLNSFELVNDRKNALFLRSTYNSCGGFQKFPDSFPDILHTYFGLSALGLRVLHNLSTQPDIQSIFPALIISQRAYFHLKSIHKKIPINSMK